MRTLMERIHVSHYGSLLATSSYTDGSKCYFVALRCNSEQQCAVRGSGSASILFCRVISNLHDYPPNPLACQAAVDLVRLRAYRTGFKKYLDNLTSWLH